MQPCGDDSWRGVVAGQEGVALAARQGAIAAAGNGESGPGMATLVADEGIGAVGQVTEMDALRCAVGFGQQDGWQVVK